MKKLFVSLLIGSILVLSLAPIVSAQSYSVLLNAGTTTGASSEVSVSSRSERTYWVYITGTATLAIQVSARAGDPFVDLVNNISSSGLVDTQAPGTRTRVNVTVCTGCTVTVVLESR